MGDGGLFHEVVAGWVCRVETVASRLSCLIRLGVEVGVSREVGSAEVVLGGDW
jgi:hypothetical protein